MSLNRIVVLGRVAQPPELRYTPDGQPVCRFVLHVDHADGQGFDPLRVIARRDLAEAIAPALQKGDLATAEGQVLLRTYQTKSGHRHKLAEIEAERVAKVPLGPAAVP